MPSKPAAPKRYVPPQPAPNGPPPSTMIRVQLDIPITLYEHYKQQGGAWDRTAESEIAERLKRCKSHVSITPLYFTDDERHEIEAALGHNCSNAGVVLQQLKQAVTLHIGDVRIELPPNVQQRLKSRVFRGDTYEAMLKREVLRGLKVYCGLLPA